MSDNLFDLVKQFAGDAVINNPAIPNERNDEVIAAASGSIQGGFQDLLSQGNISDVLKLFGGRDNGGVQNSITQQISGGLIENLIGKFGLDKQSAGGIAGGLIPAVLSNLVSKANDPNDSSFDVQSLLNNFSGGKTSGVDVQGLLNKVRGGVLDLDGDGDTDLQDLLQLFNQGKGGGGLMDKIKGMFGS
ncbi:MAG: hypothetical protein KF746_08445 [Chitinophagaceae bacterium]|nr:hypothetical protein [Chitinophagaceae bacterium]